MEMSDKFKRWHDFSFRMAKTFYKRRKSPSFTWILATLDQCFEYIKNVGVHQFKSWDETTSYSGSRLEIEALCDWFQEVIEYEVWTNPRDFATVKEQKQLDRWEADFDKYDQVKEQIVNRVCEPVRCCLRAGLDLVGEQSGGVLGFTVGDLKQMYPKGVPEWVASKFLQDLNLAENNQGIWL